ncbi:type VI secretion system protein TssA [Colwellia asteriadis]|uniref:Type VI secretion system protein TssA n=1 Tax=Colwellia asteriadis TaxID=517723 RepID=A0ABP3WI72_9GAMM
MIEHYTHDNWQAWLDNISTPFTEVICGEDLKYEEDFKFLKSSFSGVNELDCKKIFITSTQLLSDKSKDLRIASYVLFAAASDYGVEGLVNGFALINGFVTDFWDDLHPIKDKARKAVHVWLLGQQSRIIALVEQKNNFEPERIVELQKQLAIYSTETLKKVDENAGPLSEFVQWAEKLNKKYPVEIEKAVVEKTNTSAEPQAAKVVENTGHANTSERSIKSAPIINVIDSDNQFNEALRKLLAFDKEKQNLSRFIALSRAARWSDMKLPPNEQGRTRIPAPRNTAFTPIVNALANEDFLSALLLGEALFMEGAMHFNLDLQIMQLSALKGLGKNTITQQLEFSLYQLSVRFPQLSQLTYDDGSALCSAKAKDVIADISAQFTQSTTVGNPNDEAFEAAEVLAKTQVEQGKLEVALTTVSTLVTRNAYERAQVLLIKAKLCLLAERYDFAGPMLLELVESIEKQQLDQWQPALAMQVWRNAVLCFDTLAASGEVDLAERSKILKGKMILTQPEVALGWI